MASQNLVSAVITTELKTSILTKLTELKSDLSFVIAILPEEKNEYVKVGKGMIPFLDLANNTATTHPEILPSVFNIREFTRDFTLMQDLTLISERLNEIASAVENTLYAAGSDSLSAALEVYAAVQQNKDKVPGMDTTAAEMKTYFKKSKKNVTAPTTS